jgi:hypothetical protein
LTSNTKKEISALSAPLSAEESDLPPGFDRGDKLTGADLLKVLQQLGLMPGQPGDRPQAGVSFCLRTIINSKGEKACMYLEAGR